MRLRLFLLQLIISATIFAQPRNLNDHSIQQIHKAIGKTSKDELTSLKTTPVEQYFKVKIIFPGGYEHEFYCSNETYILDEAEKNGLTLPYSSRAGVDFTSAALLVSGTVDISDQSLLCDKAIDAGFILLDVAYPTSDCVIYSHKETDAVDYWMTHCN